MCASLLAPTYVRATNDTLYKKRRKVASNSGTNEPHNITINRELYNRNEQKIEEIVIGQGSISSIPLPEISENSASFGFMFNLKTNKKIAITGFQFFTRTVEEVKYELYAVTGEYSLSKHDIKLWSLIGSGTTNSYGITKPTAIERMQIISLQAHTITGFYMSLQTQNLVYLSSNKRLGAYSNTNNDIAISTGSGVSTYPLEGSFFEPRSWCGVVNYYIMDYSSLSPSSYPTLTPSRQASNMPSTRAPTRNPTSYPTRTPTISPTDYPTEVIQYPTTNQTFTLFGSNLDFMDRSMEKVFCNEIKTSVKQDLFKKYGNDLEITTIKAKNQLLLGSDYNEMGVIIETRYTSPLDIDISNVIKSSITNKRQSILVNLQRDGKYFLKVSRIVSVETPRFEKDYQIANVNQSISLYFSPYSSVELMNTYTAIKYENEICSFFNKEIRKLNSNSFIVMAYVNSQSFSIERHSLDTWVTIQVKFYPSSSNFDMLGAIESIIKDHKGRLYYQLTDSDINIFLQLKGINALIPSSSDNLLPSVSSVNNVTNIEVKDINLTTSSIKDFFTSTLGYITVGVAAFTIFIISIAIGCYCNCCCSKDYDEYEDVVVKRSSRNLPRDDGTWTMSSRGLTNPSYGRESYANNGTRYNSAKSFPHYRSSLRSMHSSQSRYSM